MICAFFQIFESIRISFFGALRALKDTKFTLLTSLISFWCVSLPVGYYFATAFELRGRGLWLGMVVGVMISVFMLFFRFRSRMSRHYVLTS